MMNRTPARARAVIRGAGAWAGVNGLATFRQCRRGVLVTVEVHGLPVGETGIKVVKIGPWAIGDEAAETWQFSDLPSPTKQCDTCAARRALGKVPTCVQHCQAKCLEYGPLEELNAKLAAKTKQAVFALGE